MNPSLDRGQRNLTFRLLTSCCSGKPCISQSTRFRFSVWCVARDVTLSSLSRWARCMLPSREMVTLGLRYPLRPSRALATQAPPVETTAVHPIPSPKSSVTATNASQSIKGHGAPKAQLSVRYPYFVRRTESGNLPVYTDTKGNGLSDIVHIRRIEGNVHVGHILYPLASFTTWNIILLSFYCFSRLTRARHVETQRSFARIASTARNRQEGTRTTTEAFHSEEQHNYLPSRWAVEDTSREVAHG
jgi:hypothetical protein